MESGGEARLTHPTALETYRILSDEALACLLYTSDAADE